jgi:uncharacterized membrane protein
MPKKKVVEKVEKPVKGEDDSKLFALLAVLLSIIGFVIALIAKKDNKYVMFYAKQSLVLFIAGIIVKVATIILAITIVGIIFIPIVWILYAILWIFGIIYSLSGEMKEVPLIGKYARKINL